MKSGSDFIGRHQPILFQSFTANGQPLNVTVVVAPCHKE
jgi:hypothetical protein